MPAGRPSDYTADTIFAAWEYATSGWRDAGDKVPSVAGLACEIGVHRDTCYAWAKDPEKAEFSDILKMIAQTQERVLINRGLAGEFNAPITKMMMSKHGYADAVDNTSSDGSMGPTRIEIVAATADDVASED